MAKSPWTAEAEEEKGMQFLDAFGQVWCPLPLPVEMWKSWRPHWRSFASRRMSGTRLQLAGGRPLLNGRPPLCRFPWTSQVLRSTPSCSMRWPGCARPSSSISGSRSCWSSFPKRSGSLRRMRRMEEMRQAQRPCSLLSRVCPRSSLTHRSASAKSSESARLSPRTRNAAVNILNWLGRRCPNCGADWRQRRSGGQRPCSRLRRQHGVGAQRSGRSRMRPSTWPPRSSASRDSTRRRRSTSRWSMRRQASSGGMSSSCETSCLPRERAATARRRSTIWMCGSWPKALSSPTALQKPTPGDGRRPPSSCPCAWE
mmetsp:Transcript_103866/g.330274  ORF Transcript_103866/g.330274 Transcript_103866/m.330274 type:complete len:313 (-) Transcript_103866:393-1331(-)